MLVLAVLRKPSTITGGQDEVHELVHSRVAEDTRPRGSAAVDQDGHPDQGGALSWTAIAVRNVCDSAVGTKGLPGVTFGRRPGRLEGRSLEETLHVWTPEGLTRDDLDAGHQLPGHPR
jgi:hypothetical protein